VLERNKLIKVDFLARPLSGLGLLQCCASLGSEKRNSARDGFRVQFKETRTSSDRNSGSEKRTQRPIDGPQSLPFLRRISFIGPSAPALKASKLRDFFAVVFTSIA
jgi:hypothetical protein